MKTRKLSRLQPVWQPYLFALPYMAIYLCFSVYPLLYSLFISFTSWNGISDPVFVGIENYKTLFTADKLFGKALGNTLSMMILPLPMLILCGLILASLVNSRYLHGRRVFQTLFFMPYLTAPVSVGLLFALLFDWKAGAVNAVLAKLGFQTVNWLGEAGWARLVLFLLVFWKYIGFYMVLLMAGLSSVPQSIYDAALVDGAGPIQTFFRITLPQMKGVMMFVILQGIAGGMQMVEDPMTLFTGWSAGIVGGPGRSCLTVMWYMMDTAFGTGMKYGKASAISYILFVMIAIISLTIYLLMNKKEDE